MAISPVHVGETELAGTSTDADSGSCREGSGSAPEQDGQCAGGVIPDHEIEVSVRIEITGGEGEGGWTCREMGRRSEVAVGAVEQIDTAAFRGWPSRGPVARRR